jgi:hypothetical protein
LNRHDAPTLTATKFKAELTRLEKFFLSLTTRIDNALDFNVRDALPALASGRRAAVRMIDSCVVRVHQLGFAFGEAIGTARFQSGEAPEGTWRNIPPPKDFAGSAMEPYQLVSVPLIFSGVAPRRCELPCQISMSGSRSLFLQPCCRPLAVPLRKEAVAVMVAVMAVATVAGISVVAAIAAGISEVDISAAVRISAGVGIMFMHSPFTT